MLSPISIKECSSPFLLIVAIIWFVTKNDKKKHRLLQMHVLMSTQWLPGTYNAG